MACSLRIEYPGAWYHVMDRGRRAERIFHDRNDYQAFVELLRETEQAQRNRRRPCICPDQWKGDIGNKSGGFCYGEGENKPLRKTLEELRVYSSSVKG